MKILLTGQCTIHWGRMEFGNIGNYFIIEPFIRQLHAAFNNNATIKTTFQLSDRFCKDEKVTCLPMELYYGGNKSDFDLALKELSLAELYAKTGALHSTTPYIEAVLDSDLIIDFSGDIWGDNANFLGAHRFLIGLIKDRVAQLLDKKTSMIAGSPGPFTDTDILPFAKEVFENFDLVTNREALSEDLLFSSGFNTSKVKNLSCPAFLFEPTLGVKKQALLESIPELSGSKPIVGFILCGWNFNKGPFDLWPRDDKDYTVFIESIEYIVKKYDVEVCLMSHSNGFPIPPAPFELRHGRDYPIIKQIESILIKRKRIHPSSFFALNGVYDAWDSKAIVSTFDMLISGRVHAAVAGMSQFIPTVVIDYGHEPKAHKLRGFANEVGMINMVADPSRDHDLQNKIHDCWENRTNIKQKLKINMQTVNEKAKQNFIELKSLFN